MLGRFVEVVKIHEVDPVQAFSGRRADAVAWSTEPFPGGEERTDVYVIAGYHHTHAPIAEWALQIGASVVVEKPLAVDEEQLRRLEKAASRGSGRFFGAFQRRYSPFNRYAREDLGLGVDQPVSYHCIAYEVPLPERHWYRWPNSHGRLVSNGCHWIDHFMFLNGYAKPSWYDAREASDGTVTVAVELVNDALFTMVLTEKGSERLGVREHIELRANGRTVTITDGRRYIAEDRRRVVRRARVGGLDSYSHMYRTIGEQLLAGAAGDSREAVIGSTALTLALERELGTGIRGSC